MTTLRATLLNLLLIVLALPLASCGNEDDNEGDNNNTPLPIASESHFKGTTTTHPEAEPSDIYTSTVATYYIKLDQENNTAILSIENANFLQGMPPLGIMEFKGLTFTVDTTDGQSTVNLTCPALTPEIAGRPFPAFPISDLSATMQPEKSLSLTFTCGYRGTPYIVTFTGTPTN